MTLASAKLPNSAPRKPERFTAEQMIAAIKVKRGFVSAIAAYLRCDPETVRNYARRYPTVAAALREERETTTDAAEAALFQAIANGEAWAVCFYLKTQGKGRGYVERTEISGPDGGAIKFYQGIDPEAV